MSKSIVRRVAWKVASCNLSIASVRYRALLPIVALERFGIRYRFFSIHARRNWRNAEAVVFVKCFSTADLYSAQQAAAMSVPVILDLCDNIFIEQYIGKKGPKPADVFVAMASIASAVVVTTDPLREVVIQHIGDDVPVYVIPDGIEDDRFRLRASAIARTTVRYQRFHEIGNKICGRLGSVIKRIAHAAAAPQVTLRRLHPRNWHKLPSKLSNRLRPGPKGVQPARELAPPKEQRKAANASTAQVVTGATLAVKPAIQSAQKPKTVLWFGNHGAPHAQFGIEDILCWRAALERIAAEVPVELLVVSNHRGKYEQLIKPMAIRSRYVEWSPAAMERAFAEADVVIVPNSLDAFSICKSANRALLAMQHKVPVVATATPALMALQDCVWQAEDVYEGLRRSLNDPNFVQAQLVAAEAVIAREFSSDAIAKRWLEVLSSVASRPSREYARQDGSRLWFCLHLIQDLDLALPLIDAAISRSIPVEVLMSLGLLSKSPRVLAALRQRRIAFHVLPDDCNPRNLQLLSNSDLAFVAIAETNLGPHRFPYRWTQEARRRGLRTCSLQHGFENVGLTYSDEVHPVEHIEFAAERILLWGGRDTLHPAVPESTRQKCVPVGCPKPALVEQPVIQRLEHESRPIVGVFENLHWHRYDDAYRSFFLDGVRTLAAANPHLMFLVKPHHAGMWLTDRHSGDKPDADNLIVIDPRERQWEGCTAPQLFGYMTAIITTPSTVALDAARAGLPVAVVGHRLALDNYAPLPLITDAAGWQSFVDEVANDAAELCEAARRFTARVLHPGDGVQTALSHISGAATAGGVE